MPLAGKRCRLIKLPYDPEFQNTQMSEPPRKKAIRLYFEIILQASFQLIEGNHLCDFAEFLFGHEILITVITDLPGHAKNVL